MHESTTGRDRARARAAGFTLVELMITLAVASVLLAIAVPSFSQMVVSNRLTTQTNELVTALNLARSEAIKRNASVTFCRSATSTPDACATSSASWNSWIVRAANGTIVQRGQVNTFNGALAVTSALFNDQVTFGPDGLARTNGAIIARNATNNTIRICSRRAVSGNVRQIALGAGSRLVTTSADGTC